MREIRLYGALGREFGRVHRMAVDGAAEAIRALCANFARFEQALRGHPVGFQVIVGDRILTDVDQVRDPAGSSEVIRIIPATAGSKSKWLGIFLGIGLIAASFFIPGLPAVVGQILFGVGANLVLGGIAQMLAPHPKQQPGADNSPENKPSYVFNGPVNTSIQGGAVPVGYGRMIVGSAVISAGLSVQEIPL